MAAIIDRPAGAGPPFAREPARCRSERLLARIPSAWVRNSMAIVLAGGRGTRLAQLTDWRAKPAVSFGGSYRIIDFALSNCVNSGLRRIGVCTQYKAQSLIGHLQRAWSFLDGRFDEFVELLPAQQRLEPVWYRGTADAVYQNIDLLLRHGPQFVVVLAGDHVYKMDYQVLLAEHVESGAAATIACIEMPLAEASAFGVVESDAGGWIRRFEEKPARPRPMPGQPGLALASMGIYVFDAEVLYEELARDAAEPRSQHDFGRDLIPAMLARGCRLRAHNFRASCVNMARGLPYWRDVGTVDAFWEANLELTRVVPDLNLYDREWPIWTWQEQLPPAKFVFDDEDRRGIAPDSLVASGCIVSGTRVRRSLLSTNVRVDDAARIEDSVLLPNVQVGQGAVLRRTVVDKYCRIPPGLVVGVDPEADRRRFHVTRNGVTLITPEMLGQALHVRPHSGVEPRHDAKGDRDETQARQGPRHSYAADA
jgi:glucose-1-phosphate adenylyltransferase